MLAWSIASPDPAIHTGVVFRLFATAAEVISTAPPWSQTRQQSSRLSGHEITRELSTSSTVIGPPNGCVSLECMIARGLSVAHSRVVTAICAKSACVEPHWYMWRVSACE